MRTDEELLAAVHRRSSEIRRQRRARRVRLTQALALATGAAAAVILALNIPNPHSFDPAENRAMMQASLLADGGSLGYVAVAILAFLLGIAVALFCFYLKKNEKEDGHDREH